MEAKTKSWVVLPFPLLVEIFMQQCVHGESKVPYLFVVWDYLSNNGNNNKLPTTTKSNYKSYGIDFPTSPIERFTNEQTSIDLIGNNFFWSAKYIVLKLDYCILYVTITSCICGNNLFGLQNIFCIKIRLLYLVL